MKRIAKAGVLVALVTVFSGCPASPTSLAYGVWFFTRESPPAPPLEQIGLIMLQDGYTEEPPAGFPGMLRVFSGTLTWQRTGDVITITQDITTMVYIFTGTIDSPTSMSGTFEKVGDPSDSGTWSAELAPSS